MARINKAISGTQSALTQFQFADAASTLYQFLWGEFCDWYIELSKGSLYGTDEEAKQSTRAVLVYCLDHILRLLHPFMPFITEEIWQKLPITRPAESICLAPYPEVNRRLDDPSAEAEMKPLIEAIDGLRAIRGESNLAPGLKLAAHIQTNNAQNRATLEKWRSYLMPLAGLSLVQITAPGIKPPQSAAEVRGDLEIYVPLAGIVDLAEERTRIQKEITKAENELVGLKKRLDNESFVKRAPPEVVEKDRARIDELTGRVTKLHDNLGRIQPVQVKIAPPAEGSIDLGEELKEELAQVTVAVPDAQVKEALDKLREGTKEGLTSKDHYDLGVAYMGMGLVDDAVREFTVAKEGEPTPKKSAPGAAKKPTAAAKKSKASAKPAAKKAAPKAKASPQKAAAKKPAAKGKRK